MGHFNHAELQELGLKQFGHEVFIGKNVSFYNAENISIGNNVRIDDFCILSAGSGGISIGNHVHIAPFCTLIGKGEIILADFSGLSSRVSIYSSTDDYSGDVLTNPTVPETYKNIIDGPVELKKHVIVGSGSIIMPNICLFEGAAIGALSLVTTSIPAFTIAAGIPAVPIKQRNRKLLELEKSFHEFHLF